MTIDAGSLGRTIQFMYLPIAPDQYSSPGRFVRVVWAFDLKSYDSRGREFQPTLRRPRVPQVTNYFPNHQSLVFRLLHLDRFAILTEARPT